MAYNYRDIPQIVREILEMCIRDRLSAAGSPVHPQCPANGIHGAHRWFGLVDAALAPHQKGAAMILPLRQQAHQRHPGIRAGVHLTVAVSYTHLAVYKRQELRHGGL